VVLIIRAECMLGRFRDVIVLSKHITEVKLF